MATDRPLVVLAGPIHPAGHANLETEARVVVCDDETEAGFLKVAAEADGMLFRAKPMCTASLMVACKRLTVVGRLQATMRLAMHIGLARNSIPSASAATFRNPASVSSSHTTTRASVSRLAWPAGWMGPARTTRGRSVAIERGLLWVRDYLRATSTSRGASSENGVPSR